jgi:predicted Fe-S protein YdhL (DUF1289 family)
MVVSMTKDEALRLALEALENIDRAMPFPVAKLAIKECKAALEAKDEPVKITHKHEWFRTGEMKVGQMRCISCGTWGQEEIPQRTWVGLTNEERADCWETIPELAMRKVEAKLKEKNT